MGAVLRIPGHEHQRAREVSLEEIRAVLGDCRLCPLGETRRNIVFGVGNPNARVVFVGEAPGATEDEMGLPFVGRAGELLDRMLAEQAGLRREDVYIANVLKCRPPGNRDPRPEEVQVCSPYLREQIRSIWPDVIMTMGNPATRFILRTEAGITRLRGKVYKTGYFSVLPTFHPAAVLRDQTKMPELAADFSLLGQILRGEVVARDIEMNPAAGNPAGARRAGAWQSPAGAGGTGCAGAHTGGSVQ